MGSLALVSQPVLEKENSEFKPALHHLKIYSGSDPAHKCLGGTGRVSVTSRGNGISYTSSNP